MKQTDCIILKCQKPTEIELSHAFICTEYRIFFLPGNNRIITNLFVRLDRFIVLLNYFVLFAC